MNKRAMDFIRLLADPGPVAQLQRFCGVEYESPVTCDQHTQTRRGSSDSNHSDKEALSVPTTPERRCLDGAKVEDGSIDHSIIFQQSVDRNSDDCILPARQRNVTSGNCQEQNNNLNKNTANSHLKFEDEKTKCKSRNFTQTNGYHVVDQDGKYTNGSIVKCRKVPQDESSKEDTDDNGSENSDSPMDSASNPAVRIKYKSLFYLARFGAFLGHELFYLTFFPFLIWNLDSLVVRQVRVSEIIFLI